MGLKCLSCGKDELAGILTFQMVIPMAQKGGSVNMAGVKIPQTEMKNKWDKDHTGDEDRVIRGPIICLACEAHHYYVKGAVPALRLGSYEDACERGIEALLQEDCEE
ncbi:MAG: hypothetical protein DRQ64_00255 [Gammaproteobacteria bacterium]|nr:MAG: hypothetical protein DRQ64_00255 [Gammaproteobacteria bacterium]